MNDRQRIVFNETGQSLVWDCPEGRPTSVTGIQVWRMGAGDNGTAESATTGSATVETDPNTTVDANSGAASANPRRLNVTATTGFAIADTARRGKRRQYLVTGSGGESEWFECMEISSGDHIVTRDPLKNDYVSTNTVQSTRISIGMANAFVQDSNKITDGYWSGSYGYWNWSYGTGVNSAVLTGDTSAGYRVRVEYVVSSVTYVHDHYFDLVRYNIWHTVTPAEMVALVSTWKDRLPTYHQGDEGRLLLDEACNLVEWDMAMAGLKLTNVRARDGLNILVKHKAWFLLERDAVSSGRAQDTTALQIAKDEYESQLDQLVRVTRKLTSSADNTGRGVVVPARNLMSK